MLVFQNDTIEQICCQAQKEYPEECCGIMLFVKAKVALEELEEGEVLKVHMNGGEPANNVPRSIKEEGHEILDFIENSDGTYDLIVRKVGE